jgi:hypothetical protein
MATALLDLPESGVWIHERQLYNIIGATSGEKFGRRDCLTCLVAGIEKGYWGNRTGKGKSKDFLSVEQGAMIGFAQEGTQHHVSFQKFGADELFPGGRLDSSPGVGKPRWFRSGEALVEVEDQLRIVNQLMGETAGLDEDTELRRQKNFIAFVKGDDQDGGFARHDVPYIAYEWRDIWGPGITANPKFPHRRRAFKPRDLKKIENYMRLMILASNKYGKLEVKEGQLVRSSSTRTSGGDVLPVTQPTKKKGEKKSKYNILLNVCRSSF